MSPLNRPGDLSRRVVLGAIAAATVQTATGRGLANDPGVGPVIDAHVHVWTPDTAKYPLAAGFKVADMRPPSFTPEELLVIARPLGIQRIVLIQMSFYRSDNRYMLDTMARYPTVFAGVGIVEEDDQAVAQMRSLAKHGVRGFRIVSGRKSPAAWLASSPMAQMWRCAADEGLAICPLMSPLYLSSVAEMCDRFPKTRVVIDHFARIGSDGEIRPADVDALCQLARHPNVYVKLSAFYALGRKQAPYDDLLPMVDRLVSEFGPQRLMWATDCPYQVQNDHTYEASLALVRERLVLNDPTAREWLLAKTAEGVFFGRC